MPPRFRAPGRFGLIQIVPFPSEVFQQRTQLFGAAVNIANDVERPILLLLVVPERYPSHFNIISSLQNVNMAESLPFKPPKAPLQFCNLPVHYMRSEGPLWPLLVPILADSFRRIDDQRDSEAVVFSRVFHQALTIFRAHVRRVNYRKLSARQTLLQKIVECIEGIWGRGLIIFVITDQTAEEV